MRHAPAILVDKTGWLKAARKRLIQQVWGGSLPSAAPSLVEPNYAGTSVKTYYNSDVASVTRLTFSLPRGGLGVVHVAYPTAARNGAIACTSAGHNEVPEDQSDGTNMGLMSQAWLRAGCVWIGGSMPFMGHNPSTLAVTADNGLLLNMIASAGHHDFSTYATQVSVDPMRWYVDPMLLAINWAVTGGVSGITRVVADGISGGGFTTDLLAAVEPRINRSYPTCDSLPFDLAKTTFSLGTSSTVYSQYDWESRDSSVAFPSNPAWYGPSYLNGGVEILYALGALESGRRRVQWLRDNDPVFTAVTLHTQLAQRAATVQAWVNGHAEIRIDTTAEIGHTESASMRAAILADALA